MYFFKDFEEELGSEEESGKDWSELEEEAIEGNRISDLCMVILSLIQMKNEYDQ
jgi:hypothetical protein